jgi:hypothetical protein
MLMGSLGCRAGHGESGGSLDGLGSKLETAAVFEYIIQPAKFEPSGRNPSLMFDESEATQRAYNLMQKNK